MSEVLSEFARTLATDFPIQGILDHLVNRIVTVLPIDAAGVTLISPGSTPRYIAASDPSGLRFERLQTELAEGPCLAAYASDRPISIPDLALDHRFPRFAERALEEGLVAVFTFPLRDGDLGLGALDLYRESAGALSDEEMDAAQTLANVAAAYLLNAQARANLEAVSATEHQALEALRVADRRKAEFLATVIHELRTPMSSISGYTEMLHDEDTGALNTRQEQMLGAIERNSRRLAALADDLLTLAELEEGVVLANHAEVDLCDMVRAARSAMEALVGARRLEITVDLPPDPVVVVGEARDLERLVANLLTNAVKYTDDGGWVRCRLHTDGGTAFLEVSDNGIGIPESELNAVFSRFFRASTARKQPIPGSGLGLNIVETIAHNHGGKVSVTSALGRGTTFVVQLPLHRATTASPEAPAHPWHQASLAGPPGIRSAEPPG